MPRVSKEALSQYIRTECRRQLRLNLSPDSGIYRRERAQAGMPPPQPPRPGLEQFTQAGEEWQAQKLHDLTQTFGVDRVLGTARPDATGRLRFEATPLERLLASATPPAFLAEATFAVGPTFLNALGIAGEVARLGLTFSDVRPDLIEVMPAGSSQTAARADGESVTLPAGDARLHLRIIDIKLTAEPSPSYFAEVAYYTMALAGWLEDMGLSDRFVASPEGAVWPGSHEASVLARTAAELRQRGQTPTAAELRAALAEDLEPVPFAVFAYRVRRFLREDVPGVLDVADWRALPWHVDNRCKGCENLGYPWTRRDGTTTNHPDHCWPTAAQTGHLSRVAFVSRGAGQALAAGGITSVPALATLSPTDTIFDAHQALRATRTVIAGRAASLASGQALIPPAAGTSAIMPRWADLRVYLSTDFDIGSAITVAFGVQVHWVEPHPFGTPPTGRSQFWKPRVFVVDLKDLAAEQRELLAFLAYLDRIMTWCRDENRETTVQLYLWDTLQYEHLCRVIGRHLDAILANNALAHLAWLFPPEDLLPNPSLVTRRSPLTIVQDVIRAVLAAPIPHYYSLLETARTYHAPRPDGQTRDFHVHPLFEDALSDQIPSERAHEIWSRTSGTRSWTDQLRTLEETVGRRLDALAAIVRRLEDDLRPLLTAAAPRIAIEPPRRVDRVGVDGQLWYHFARLDAAIAELEVHTIRAMPPHERAARFQSARLTRRLTGAEEEVALQQLGLDRRVGRRVYELRADSREVKLKEGDFNCALAPEETPGFLDRNFFRLVEGTPLQAMATNPRDLMEDVTRVTVRKLDRANGLIALDADNRRPQILDQLERHGLVDLSHDVTLDPVHADFFTGRLKEALRAIGNPGIAGDNPHVRRVTGQPASGGARRSAHTPPADVLWDAARLATTPTDRPLATIRTALAGRGVSLNPSQWAAWEQALGQRLALIWGPPGTGKSHTLRAVVLGAALGAHLAAAPLRILICAATHTALDQVLLGAYRAAGTVLAGTALQTYRLRSRWRAVEADVPPEIDTEVSRETPSPRVMELVYRLTEREGITIVGATPEQTHNLLQIAGGAQGECFDLILIDEASQMDVPHAILPLCGLAAGGSVVLAGDPKQLPPIHQAEPPKGLENLVGSVYTFVENLHRVAPVMLDRNYRSNATIVRLAHRAGYRETLTAHSPNLRLDFIRPLPANRPESWPDCLPWTEEWAALLDPDHPAVCFVYSDGRSSQWNQFEADAVAALARLPYGRLGLDLVNRLDETTGRTVSPRRRERTWEEFWGKGIGIVTPHRAQQGLVVRRLTEAFAEQLMIGKSIEAIRAAVDTVERFQGQERDVILASFALGDPDAIASEDEFLHNLNRFNVMVSRPRAKLIVFISQEVVDHLSSDKETLWGSSLLKTYVESFCACARPMTLPHLLPNGEERAVHGRFRWAP